MTDIFFSYSSADRERVRPIRDALVAQGFEVFWDLQVPAGMDWDTWIRQHLTKSKCAMAFWSATSVSSDNVRHEATVAKQQGKLISVLLEPLTAEQFPMGLYAQQAANLSGWSGDYGHDEWRKFRREFEAKLTPLWVRRQIDELEAELVGERARREGVERRDKVLQTQIAKEVAAQQDLKEERDKAIDEAAGLKARVEELTQARLDAETREARAQQASKQEREKVLDEAAGLKATVEKLTRAGADAEAREARLQQDLKLERDKALNDAAVLKATVEELTRAQADAEAREAQAQKDLKRGRDKALYEAAALRATARAAWFARSSVMQFGSIAAAMATVGFWTYYLIWSAPHLPPPNTSESAAVQQEEVQRRAKAAADVEARLKVAETEQQELKDEVQRQAKAAAGAEAKLKAAETEQQRLKDDAQLQAKAAADADARRKSAEAEQERLNAEVQRLKAAQAQPPGPPASVGTLAGGYREPAASTGLFTIRSGTEVIGRHESRSLVSSIVECERDCARSGACKVFSYEKTLKWCYFYNQASSFSSNGSYDSGIRK